MTKQISISSTSCSIANQNRIGTVVSDKNEFWQNERFCFQHPTSLLEKVDSDGDHSLRRYHRLYASYQKWFQSDWTLREDDFVSVSKLIPPNGLYYSMMEQTKKWLGYQLDDSTAEKLDDRPFPLFLKSLYIYFNISDVVLLYYVPILSAQQRGSDFSSD